MIKMMHEVIKELIKVIYSLNETNSNLTDEDKSLMKNICDLLNSINEKI